MAPLSLDVVRGVGCLHFPELAWACGRCIAGRTDDGDWCKGGAAVGRGCLTRLPVGGRPTLLTLKAREESAEGRQRVGREGGQIPLETLGKCDSGSSLLPAGVLAQVLAPSLQIGHSHPLLFAASCVLRGIHGVSEERSRVTVDF